MARILSGKEVAQAVMQECIELRQKLFPGDRHPRLALFRAGEATADICYEKNIHRACEQAGIMIEQHDFPADIDQEAFAGELRTAADNDDIQGILVLSPLPAHLDQQELFRLIPASKDIDCLNPLNSGAVYTQSGMVYPPCTAAAVLQILKYYRIPLCGKTVIVVGGSLIVGKPVAMLLLEEGATVTMAHDKSENLPALCRNAEIIISATGVPRLIGVKNFSVGQTVIDVGINDDPLNPGKICGDVDEAAASEMAKAYTPVPGGVGSVTSVMLCRHLLESCKRSRQ